jgi:hypothetical protein
MYICIDIHTYLLRNSFLEFSASSALCMCVCVCVCFRFQTIMKTRKDSWNDR